jgi:amino acid adenylation domain-containing protein
MTASCFSTDPVSLVELFERQPANAAAHCEGKSITFFELNRRANQLARYLRDRNVRPDVPVGIFIPHSLQMLIALLGIFKAGGAYLPLDPNYPQERLRFMVEDSRVAVAICHGQEEALSNVVMSTGRKVEVVDLDRDWERISLESDADIGLKIPSDCLAYVIYTSGSTGKPKGVMGTHRGMLNRMSWMWQHFPFQSSEVCCVKTSLNFLDSFWEIFGPLLQGIPVLLLPEKTVKDAEQFTNELEKFKVSRLVLVPSLLRVILSSVENVGVRLGNLKLWTSSGEALTAELVRDFYKTFPSARLLNLYGSSEVSADCTWYDTSESSPEALSIGRPITDFDIHVVDAEMREVATGEEGELCVGGVGLARGYLGRPDLTAERFLPNPFGSPGSRLFHSGDLARRRPDQTLEYLGRRDQQVKIRGFRVELGEIEAVLAAHPEISQAVVILREKENSQKQLIAYVVPVTASVVSAAVLREYLSQRLPDYMCPAAIVELRELPLTPSGKLDRNALSRHYIAAESRACPPRTAQEETLANIFALVLGLEKVSITDRFFDLGGDSLAAVELASCARRAGFQISSLDVLRRQTVSALATVENPVQPGSGPL